MKHQTRIRHFIFGILPLFAGGNSANGQNILVPSHQASTGLIVPSQGTFSPVTSTTPTQTLPATTVESVHLPYKPLYPPSAYDPSRRVTANEYFSMYEITGNYQVNRTRADQDGDEALSAARRKRDLMDEMAVIHRYVPAATTTGQLLANDQVPAPEAPITSPPAAASNSPRVSSDLARPPENIDFVDMRNSSGVSQLRVPRLRKRPDASNLTEIPFIREAEATNDSSRNSSVGQSDLPSMKGPRIGSIPHQQAAESAAPPLTSSRPTQPLAAAGPPVSSPDSMHRSAPERNGLFGTFNRPTENRKKLSSTNLPESTPRPAPLGSNPALLGPKPIPTPANAALLSATQSSVGQNKGLFGAFRKNARPNDSSQPSSPEPMTQPLVTAAPIPMAISSGPPSPPVAPSQTLRPRPSKGWSMINGEGIYANVDGQIVKLSHGTRVEVLKSGESFSVVRLFDQRQATVASSALLPEE